MAERLLPCWSPVAPVRSASAVVARAARRRASRSPPPGSWSRSASAPRATSVDRASDVRRGRPARPAAGDGRGGGGGRPGGGRRPRRRLLRSRTVHETSRDDFDAHAAPQPAPAFLLAHAAMPRLVRARRRRVRRRLGAARAAAVHRRRRATSPPRRRCSPSSRPSTPSTAARACAANAILPSVIDTPANRAAQPDADHSKWVPAAEIAKVVRFLVSDDSAPTSGAAMPVYGRA